MQSKIHPLAVTVAALLCPLLAFAQDVAPLDTETLNRLTISDSSNFNFQLQPGHTAERTIEGVEAMHLLRKKRSKRSLKCYRNDYHETKGCFP